LTEDEAYLEHIDSSELKKLINLLYSSKPESAVQLEPIKQDNLENSKQIDAHNKIVKRLDELIK
jgi:hypothetical protein